MTVKQLSVFLENKPGRLAELTKALRQNGIDMRAMSIADAPDFGIARVIVDDPYEAACVLKDAGYVLSVTPVLAVAIPDEAGSLYEILRVLGENEINLEYTYAFPTAKKGQALMIFRVENNEKAIETLSGVSIVPLCQVAINQL